MSNPHGQLRRVGATALLAAALTAVPGCKAGGVAEQLGTSWTSTPVMVRSVTLRSVYLDVALVGQSFSGRLFFAATESCRAALVKGATVEYSKTGPLGQITSSAGVCPARGTGSLRRWRDSLPRPRASTHARSRASYSVVYADDEYALARGRFLLAAAIGWAVPQDTIAVIPRTSACDEPLERGVAFMEYRQMGPQPFRLVSERGDCPIVGFILPSPER